MSEYSRLSEMIGIAGDDDTYDSEQPGSVWALNAILVLLGAAILLVAFYFLDSHDKRLLFNPWSYAIATPIAVVIFSTLLNKVVSRVVEKSMQMAFLLSVLIHLLFLVYAVNIVIFSRMWPDVLDSLAAQRQQLKLESLKANQYVAVPSNKQSVRRPDHMSYVPTEHDPTEVEQATSPAIQLARNERIDLVTPTPKFVPTTSPHLIERQQPSISKPTVGENAASLSRSSLSDSQPLPNTPLLAPVEQSIESSPTLEAASATASRRRDRDMKLPLSTTPTELNRSATQAALQRAQMESDLPAAKLESMDFPSRSTSASSTAPRGSAVETPSLTGPAPTATALAPSESAAANSRRVQVASSLNRVAPDLPSPTISPSSASPPSINRSERAPSALQLPIPSAGETRAAIARDIAGGVSGPAAPSSMLVQGPDSLASNDASQGELRASPSSRAKRTNSPQSKTASLSEMGSPSSESWSGQHRLSGGVAGTSPSQLANAASGNAIAHHMAGLTGAGDAIERSTIGLAGLQGALALPAGGANVANVEATVASDSSELNGSGIEAEAAPLQRSSNQRGQRGSGVGSTAPVDSLAANVVGEQSSRVPGLPEGMQRAEGTTQRADASEANSKSVAGVERADELLGRSPVASQVAVPDAVASALRESEGDAGDEASGVASLEASGSLARKGTQEARRNAPMQVDIDALVGPTGISPIPDKEGPLLPRRNDIDSHEITPPQIESQRFSRQDVGGPLAAGRDVAMPTPAFQQRLERLQDLDAQDASSVEPQTEQAIERGLAFLARHQRPDGSWRLQDFDTPVLMRSDTAATALALLAFQGAGYTHKQSKYADTCDRALKFLAEHQTKDGDLYIPQDPASNQNAWLYSHGIAALAVCEAYGMTQDPELRPLAQGAIDFMVKSQDKTHGGWRYRPGSGTDTSVTGWFMMAFKSGQLAGLQVPANAFNRIESYLSTSQLSDAEPHLYRYNPFALDTPQQRHGLRPTAVMTSVGLLMRLYFGWQRDRPEMMDGADYLLEHEPRHGTRSLSLRDTYYWYYATQVIFHMGGERWERWHDQLYPLLIDSQVLDGENEGSWDPMLPTPDLWARYGGRLYVTTMNLLSLEVSYRHLPLYEATAPSDITP